MKIKKFKGAITMAERISMRPEDLRAAAQFFTEKLDAITSEGAALGSKIQEVTGNWEGSSSEKYWNQYETDIKPVFDKTLPEFLNSLSQQTTSIANAMEQADQDIANQIGG